MGRGFSSMQYPHAPNPNKLSVPPDTAKTRHDRRILLPNIPHGNNTIPGMAVCPRCHAIWEDKHWHLDERQYQELIQNPNVQQWVCPADQQIDKGEYDGQVTLSSPLIAEQSENFVGLIRNTEAHIRLHNPLARIAQLTAHGDTIEILTITPFLAERIGKELVKAYHGQVEFKHSERARFVRVSWKRD